MSQAGAGGGGGGSVNHKKRRRQEGAPGGALSSRKPRGICEKNRERPETRRKHGPANRGPGNGGASLDAPRPSALERSQMSDELPTSPLSHCSVLMPSHGGTLENNDLY